MNRFVYTGQRKSQLSFPLGGIGSGCIGLDGSGHLIDWEIFNRPNKGGENGFSFFALKAEAGGRVLDARVLQSPQLPPFSGGRQADGFKNFGFGPSRYTMAGVPCFEDSTFTGIFPTARMNFADTAFPGRVSLTAFNPFIPGNDRDSSIPAAFFRAEIENPTAEEIAYTLCLSLNNPHREGRRNTLTRKGDTVCLSLEQTVLPSEHPGYGGLCAAARGDAGGQAWWYRGSWFDNLDIFWQNFTAPGPLHPREYPPSGNKGEDVGSLTLRMVCPPGERVSGDFVLAWYYPNCRNYWREGADTPPAAQWRNYYASLFADAREAAVYGLTHFDRLLGETLLFRDALMGCNLPEAALEAAVSCLSVLKSPTCLRLEDGSFYGWEGCDAHTGSCEGSCTHVWNYAYALPYLFPSLERSMRDLDYTYNWQPTGAMPFRLQLPLGSPASRFRPCVDGQMGGILKVWREWKLSGDTAWLRGLWPRVKKSLEYAWSQENPDAWDADRDGVLEGRQHHTLDMELFGPNSWLNGFYLAALKAGAEMAEALDEPETAADWRQLFARGKAFTDKALFNGDYYCQQVDLKNRQILERYDSTPGLFGQQAVESYWNDEAGEMKYQIGQGCSIDQVLAQWHGDLLGLGEIFDPAQTRRALESIYRNNYVARLGRVFNPCRIYGLQDESGTQICTYPAGREKPVIPIPYAQETMHGFEYQAGIHMLLRGMEAEGLKVITAVRDRYDGSRRNPWNEIECGSNYARSMAAFALIPAWGGFTADMTRGKLSFSPLHTDYRGLWFTGSAWGAASLEDGSFTLEVLSGRLPLETVEIYGRPYTQACTLTAGERLTINTLFGGNP